MTTKIGPKKEGVLYHYTSQRNLLCIVEDRRLRISHVYYMNDANEIKYGAELFKSVIADRQSQETDVRLTEFLLEFRDWTNQLIGIPHYLFVFSLSENGNLLSQWRAYTPPGEAGISIGFSKDKLELLAMKNGFLLLKFLYDGREQLSILEAKLNDIVIRFINDLPSINTSGRPENQKYLPYFYQFSEELLLVFSQIKDPFFREENEWRLVSKYYEKYSDPEIKFREGRTTLVPFVEFNLLGMHTDGRLFEQVYVGPSSSFILAYAAVSSFLSNKKACNITINSQSPLRDL